MIGDPEDHRYEIQGWLIDLVDRIEREGARAIAVIFVDGEGNLQTNWEDPHGCWSQLVAGTVTLQQRLNEGD